MKRLFTIVVMFSAMVLFAEGGRERYIAEGENIIVEARQTDDMTYIFIDKLTGEKAAFTAENWYFQGDLQAICDEYVKQLDGIKPLNVHAIARNLSNGFYTYGYVFHETVKYRGDGIVYYVFKTPAMD